ncbi:Armadillo-type fold [Arabidopsis thaliana x Arabidopsis arenosa]|uniref:Armadillo-type fold n=1 Tax=Arabidopsis thaliana x Arabidopsis arenosa TaxID=1240361 RepID=A0A8T2D5P1_9BRAS|nr:Armadillo-type fold [Arabidopsis thaliana x Arabidopsis arenosa]
MLNLDFTHKTTQATPRLHAVATEFLRVSNDVAELHKLSSKLTSDPYLFVEFVKTIRGFLSVQTALGLSGEIDTVFLQVIKGWFPDLITETFSFLIVVRIINLFNKRANSKVYPDILRRIGNNALYLTRNPLRGICLVEKAINVRDPDCTVFIALKLHSHYVELSFEELGSNIVEKLLSVVLKKTLEFAKERRVDLFRDLVEKLTPLLDLLRGSQGNNIAAIIDLDKSEVKDSSLYAVAA